MEKLLGNYRRHRFLSLSSLEAKERGEEDPFQQGYDEGYVQGQEKGLQQGLEDGRQQGHQQGFQSGHKEGKQQGEEAGRQAFDSAMAPLANLSRLLEQTRQQQLAENTESVCHLVEQVARRVIHAELTLNPAQILVLVKEALAQFDTNKGPLQIFLSAEDHRRLAKVGINHCGDYPLTVDDALATGDCRIESDQQQLQLDGEQRLQKCMTQVQQELTGNVDAD